VAWAKAEGFRQFLTANRIGVIILNEALARDTRFRDDPEFRAFVERPEADGFTVFPVPNTRDRIAVRNDLLPAARR
jgi:DTW domain-containing protein YfiP